MRSILADRAGYRRTGADFQGARSIPLAALTSRSACLQRHALNGRRRGSSALSAA
jgi:hypothetical protein